MEFSLNNLNNTEFEEFCFDLLKSLDFTNISWRKGTGHSTSPADQGRDIECELLKRDIDGNTYFEKWFVECKHYLKGVPPEKIQGAITWANAERPDVFLIIVSNFLSNPAKNWLENFKLQNKPFFRIKVWERKDLEGLSAGNPTLLNKYDLEHDSNYLSRINQYHLSYILRPQYNTIEFFIELMEMLDSEMRDEAFMTTYLQVIQPRFREPIHQKERIKDLMIDSLDFESFKTTCLSGNNKNSLNYVFNLVSPTLAMAFHLGDPSSKDYFLQAQEGLIEHLKEEIEHTDSHRKKEELTEMIKISSQNIEELPVRMKRSQEIYNYICNELVRKLLTEKPRLIS